MLQETNIYFVLLKSLTKARVKRQTLHETNY